MNNDCLEFLENINCPFCKNKFEISITTVDNNTHFVDLFCKINNTKLKYYINNNKLSNLSYCLNFKPLKLIGSKQENNTVLFNRNITLFSFPEFIPVVKKENCFDAFFLRIRRLTLFI